MKPSGPGLLFVGNFQITVAILVLVIHLFIFSISSWFSLGRLYLSKNLSISSRLSVLLAYSYFSSLSSSFVISVMSCCNSFFISNCIDLSPLSFFLEGLDLSILFIFSNNQLLVLLIFATGFSSLFISALIFMISFLLPWIFKNSFSSCFRCKVS